MGHADDDAWYDAHAKFIVDYGGERADAEEQRDEAHDQWVASQLDDSRKLAADIDASWIEACARDPGLFQAFKISNEHWCSDPVAMYQVRGFKWLLMRERCAEETMPRGGILGDDTGLGKTYEFIKLIMSDYHPCDGILGRDPVEKKTLIVTPKAVLLQWEDEFVKFRRSSGIGSAAVGLDVRRFVMKISKITQPPATIPAHVGVVLVPYSAFKNSTSCGVPRVLTHNDDGSARVWHRMVLDEGHEIKNKKTRVHAEACAVQATCRWISSATPVQNNRSELLALASFVGFDTDAIRDMPVFISLFRDKYVLRRIADVEKLLETIEYGDDASTLMSQLPKPKVKVKRLAFKTDVERKMYDAVCSEMQRALAHKQDGVGAAAAAAGGQSILRFITFLRQICVDPRIYIRGVNARRKCAARCAAGDGAKADSSDDDDDDDDDDADADVEADANDDDDAEADAEADDNDDDDDVDECDVDVKSPAVRRLLHEYGVDMARGFLLNDVKHLLKRYGFNTDRWTAGFRLNVGTKIEYLVAKLVIINERNKACAPGAREKCVVFCEWRSEMKMIEKALTQLGVKHLAYTGGMALQDRQNILQRFNMCNKSTEAVMLVQIKSGAEGLNLQTANRLYIMSPTWNPCRELQAIGRVVRIGQIRKTVKVTRLVISGTVEEKCLRIQEKKKALIQKFMRDSSLSMRLGKALTDAEIAQLVRTVDDEDDDASPEGASKRAASGKAYDGKWASIVNVARRDDAVYVRVERMSENDVPDDDG